MSLFDGNDFDFTVLEADQEASKELEKQANADSPEDEDLAGSGTDNTEMDEACREVDEELDNAMENIDGLEEECESASDYDMECSSLAECMGSPALYDMEAEAAMICAEGLELNIALNRVDTACTEAYIRSNDEDEQQAITESFKESVKKYWERFKAFCVRIKNLIVRSVTRFFGYIKKLITKANAKLTIRSVDKRAKKNAKLVGDVEVECYANLNSDLSALIKSLNTQVADGGVVKALTAIVDGLAKGGEAARNTVDDTRVPETSEIITAVLGHKTKLKGNTFDGGSVDTMLKNIKGCDKKVFAPIEKVKKAIFKTIDSAEKKVSKATDLKPERISVVMMAINKIVSFMNKMLSVTNTVAIMWINARISVVSKLANKENDDEDDEEDKKKKKKEEKTTESFNNLFDQYLDII